jgi:hypothetical protein
MWSKGKTLSEIAKAIGRFNDKSDDPCHALRVVLTRMHAGYRDKLGKVVKLPYRASDVQLSINAGKKPTPLT